MLAARLKQLRTRKKRTQGEVAKVLGVTRPAYTAYETGKRNPDYETLQKIADYFEVSIDYLLGREAHQQNEDEKAFEKWMNDPTVYKFYKEFSDSPEERREALLAVWEIIKSKK